MSGYDLDGPSAEPDDSGVTCGPLRLGFGDGRILEWTPPGEDYPCIHILDGAGFLYLTEHDGDEAMLTDDYFCVRCDQDTADALHVAIEESEDPDVIRFREEWMR